MAACEKCADLEREVAALKKEKGELEAMLRDKRLEALDVIAHNTEVIQRRFLNKKATKYAGVNGLSRLTEAQVAVNDRLFSQYKFLFELPAKAEQMQAKTDNVKTRTANLKVDTRLKEEKIKSTQADRALKEHQTRLIEAATRVLERYARTGNMVEADFEVIDQLKEIGVKIPARLAGKNLKQTNGAR